MQVILFRHGPAGDPDPSRWPTDVDRPLTPKGIARTRASGRGLARLVGDVTCIVTSPYERALGTANVLADVFGIDLVDTLDALRSGASTRGMLAEIARRPATGRLVVVGHEPDLGVLAAHMTGARTALALKKAGACAIEFDGPVAEGAGRLLWYVPPRLLRDIRARKPSEAT